MTTTPETLGFTPFRQPKPWSLAPTFLRCVSCSKVISGVGGPREDVLCPKCTSQLPEIVALSNHLGDKSAEMQGQPVDKTMDLQGHPAFAEIAAELHRATTKFPTWPTDPLHAVAVLGEEFGELTKAMLQLVYEPQKSSHEHVREEAIQTAAMALRLVMSLDCYEYTRGKQHTQTASGASS